MTMMNIEEAKKAMAREPNQASRMRLCNVVS